MSLSSTEIMFVVNRHIGVSGGYLGDFSYRTHAEFYPEFCDLEIDPRAVPDETATTTRAKFIHILKTASARDQAKILRGVLSKYPLDRAGSVERIRAIAARLEGTVVAAPDLVGSRAVIEHSLRDAEAMIAEGRPAGAVDRLHTALHGYVRQLCGLHGVAIDADAGLPAAFSALRQHPRLARGNPETIKILRGAGAIVDALNRHRNDSTPAHPNDLLDDADALLGVNMARALLAYVHARLG